MKHDNNVNTFLLLESTNYKKYWMESKKANCKLMCMFSDLV